MNAADVLAEAGEAWDSGDGLEVTLPDWQLAALLAHGKQGVAILPDGTLWALSHGHDGHGTRCLFRLVPLSAEAGDTDG